MEWNHKACGVSAGRCRGLGQQGMQGEWWLMLWALGPQGMRGELSESEGEVS